MPATAPLPNGLIVGAGTAYPIERMEGLGLAEIRSMDLEKFNDDGDFAGQDFYKGRQVILSMGADSTMDPSRVEWVRRNLRGAFQRYTSPTGILFRPRGCPNEKMFYGMPRRCVWSEDADIALGAPSVVVEIVAPDPLIYSSTLFSRNLLGTAPVIVPNGGTWPVKPIVTVVGVAAGPIIVTLGAQSVRVDTALTGAQTLVIDFARRTITINGVNEYDLKNSVTSWWSLAPGANLLTPNQASIETDTTGLTAYSNSSIARSGAQAADGSFSLEVTAAAGGDMYAATFHGGSGLTAIPVVPGDTYTATMVARANTTTRNARLDIGWFDSGAALLGGTVSSSPVSATNAAWTSAITATGTAPAGAVTAALFPAGLAMGAGEKLFFDKLGLFSGTATGDDWVTGAANIVTYSGGGSSASLTWRYAEV